MDQITGISRSPGKVSKLGIEARFGDFDQPERLAEAFSGLDCLLVIPANGLLSAVRGEQNCNAIRKAAESDVNRIVFMSCLGTWATKSPNLWQSYFVAEQELMRLASSWTIWRMAYYPNPS